MTVVRIEIKKILTERAYALRQSTPASFSSQYLVQTDAMFPSPQLAAYSRNIAQAESRLYPLIVRFESAVVRLVTPGASAQELRGRYSNIDLGQLTGQLQMQEHDALAFPPVVGIYGRSTNGGRHGRLLIAHALTISEWNLYAQKEVVPQRFQRIDGPSLSPSSLFSHELIEAVRGANGTHIMPASAGRDAQHMRQVTDFFFHGFQVISFKSKRKKAKTSSRLEPATKSTKEKKPIEGFVYLIQSGEHYKIGRTIDMNKRRSQIKLQLPLPITTIHVIQAANSLEVEAHWHRRYASRRLEGEWFALTEAEVEEFKSVSRM